MTAPLLRFVLALLHFQQAVAIQSQMDRMKTFNFNWVDDVALATAPSCVTTDANVEFSSYLPNVLVFGDSISSKQTGYFNATKRTLQGVANLQTVIEKFSECTSFGMLEGLRTKLKKLNGKFDVITFNWGLHDVNGSAYEPVSFDAYIENLHPLYTVLKDVLAPGGHMIYVTTTPVPPNEHQGRQNTDVIKINEGALGVWRKHPDVDVFDLYSFIVNVCNEKLSDVCFPTDCECPYSKSRRGRGTAEHFDPTGNDLIGEQIAQRIHLKLGTGRSSSLGLRLVGPLVGAISIFSFLA